MSVQSTRKTLTCKNTQEPLDLSGLGSKGRDAIEIVRENLQQNRFPWEFCDETNPIFYGEDFRFAYERSII